MERLTGYTGRGYIAYDPIDTKYKFSETNLQKLIDKLAHYEDLEESGRLVVLPEGLTVEGIAEAAHRKSLACPSHIGLPESPHCIHTTCYKCWEAALKGERK